MLPEKCAKCLKPKSAQSGSLTQWIILCSCDKVPSARSEDEEIARCKSCGKPAREQRAGSLTQWIFQGDSCNCDRPNVELSPSIVPFKQAAFEGFEDEERVELEIDSAKFPIERYGPLEILGAGASGTVYLSHDRLLNKRVAVKVLRTLDRDALLSFQNEARTTSKLTHPHIVKILDFGSTDGGVPFMVMDFVAGTSLESLIRNNNGLDLDTSIKIFMQLSKALTYAHSIGVLHRDFKPSNILIVESKNFLDAFLIDFGVAKLQTYYQTATLYNGTALVGTPAYMSPDQALGRDFDVRSDIYSFGCVMFDTITGRQAFNAESPLELISLHATQSPPSILDYIEETPVSTALADVIETCLAKDPAQRYQTAEALRQALYAIPLESSEEKSQQKQLVDTADTSSKVSGIFSQPLLIAGVSILLVSICSIKFYFLADTKNATNYTKSKGTTLKKAVLGAMGSPDAEEKIKQRPSNPMPNFKTLTLTNETDTGLAHVPIDYPNLERVTILDSTMSATGLRYLRKLPIQYLKFENTNITRQHFYEISKFPSLWNLNFGVQNKIDMSGVGELRNSKVHFLKFSYIQVSEKILEDIASIKGLHTITFSNCTGFSGINIAPLTKLKELWTLDLSSSDATDDTLKPLPQTTLGHLMINNTRVTNAVFKTIAKSPILSAIYLSEFPGIDKALVKKLEKDSKKRFYISPTASVKGVDPGLLEEMNLDD